MTVVVQVMSSTDWVEQHARLLHDHGIDAPVVQFKRCAHQAPRPPHRKAEP
jgi:hypothetical protein